MYTCVQGVSWKSKSMLLNLHQNVHSAFTLQCFSELILSEEEHLLELLWNVSQNRSGQDRKGKRLQYFLILNLYESRTDSELHQIIFKFQKNWWCAAVCLWPEHKQQHHQTRQLWKRSGWTWWPGVPGGGWILSSWLSLCWAFLMRQVAFFSS